MNGCNMSGKTMVRFVTATGGSTTKVIGLTHYLCGNRRICCNGSFVPTATISYATKDITDVGNGSYVLTITMSGTINYLPARVSGCCCASECECPISEPFYVDVDVDYESATAPTYTAGTVVVSPVCKCCGQTTTNTIDIKTSVTITTPTTEG